MIKVHELAKGRKKKGFLDILRTKMVDETEGRDRTFVKGYMT